jgi:CheY-like chemotaxis protein
MAHILIIGDDAQTINMLRKILEPEGYEVVVAYDGNEGIRLYREVPSDLIIADLIMQEMETLENLVELHKNFPEVKIIALSGGTQLVSKICLNLAKSFGANYTFTKPVERVKLLNAIEELLQ